MKLRITLEGQSYEVEVELLDQQQPPASPMPQALASRPAPKQPPVFSRGGRVPKSDATTCRSPITGVVTSVEVAAGQHIERNGTVVVIEAMKMQTRITAVAAGTVKAVLVAAGEAVKPGQVLVEFE